MRDCQYFTLPGDHDVEVNAPPCPHMRSPTIMHTVSGLRDTRLQGSLDGIAPRGLLDLLVARMRRSPVHKLPALCPTSVVDQVLRG